MIRYPNDMATDRLGRAVAAIVVTATAAATGYLMVTGFTDPARLLPGSAAPAARTLTLYETVRTAVLIGAAVLLLLARRWRPLRLLLILNAITQCGDALIGLTARHSAAGTLGSACFAAALAYAAWRLGRQGGTARAASSKRRPDPRRQALLMGAPRFRAASRRLLHSGSPMSALSGSPTSHLAGARTGGRARSVAAERLCRSTPDSRNRRMAASSASLNEASSAFASARRPPSRSVASRAACGVGAIRTRRPWVGSGRRQT